MRVQFLELPVFLYYFGYILHSLVKLGFVVVELSNHNSDLTAINHLITCACHGYNRTKLGCDILVLLKRIKFEINILIAKRLTPIHMSGCLNLPLESYVG